MTFKLRVALAVIFGCISQAGFADAIIRSQAMQATTIVEYHVEESGVRVTLEIGLSNLPAFRNLLPTDIHQKMGFGDEPMASRQGRFFTEDLAIYADGSPLTGRLLSIGPGQRLKRDEITGDILARQADEPEVVVTAELEYLFESQPAELTLVAPARNGVAEIGFVLYHQGVAVNDFRYLSSGYSVLLDWTDSWYSRFSNRNLRRQYFAPMSGFIYVEPFEVRKEIIVRPKDIQRWVDLGLEGKDIIPAEMQGDIKLKVAEFLAAHHPVAINGNPVKGILDQVNFLERKLTSSRVIDPPEDLDINSAVMGAIFVYPIDALPELVTMDWDLWDERVESVPVSAVDEAGPFPQFLQSDWAVLEWKNFLKNPTIPTMATLVEPPSQIAQSLVKWRWVLVVITLVIFGWLLVSLRAGGRNKPVYLSLTIMLVAGTGLGFWLSKPALAVHQQSEAIIGGLLHNIYRAFDYRDEGTIYDVLDRSVTGDLLTDIYLETRRGLVLASQGGARAKVKDVELKEVETQVLSDVEGFDATATWVVSGSVGHWGHVHKRVNQYKADMRVEVVDGVWKITGLDILQEERL